MNQIFTGNPETDLSTVDGRPSGLHPLRICSLNRDRVHSGHGDLGPTRSPNCDVKWGIGRFFLWHLSERIGTLREGGAMPNSLPQLEAQRTELFRQPAALGDSVEARLPLTSGKCGNRVVTAPDATIRVTPEFSADA